MRPCASLAGTPFPRRGGRAVLDLPGTLRAFREEPLDEGETPHGILPATGATALALPREAGRATNPTSFLDRRIRAFDEARPVYTILLAHSLVSLEEKARLGPPMETTRSALSSLSQLAGGLVGVGGSIGITIRP